MKKEKLTVLVTAYLLNEGSIEIDPIWWEADKLFELHKFIQIDYDTYSASAISIEEFGKTNDYFKSKANADSLASMDNFMEKLNSDILLGISLDIVTPAEAKTIRSTPRLI